MSRLAALAFFCLFAFASPVFAQPADPQNTIILETTKGKVVIRLRTDLAPKHAERLKQLARDKYYDNVPFHRVIPGFMAQTGDGQRGDGIGGSKYPDLKAEFSSTPFVCGIVGMARSQNPNSANSQFFIMFGPTPSLDGQYTVIGQVTSGMENVDNLKKGSEANNGSVSSPDKILTARIAADKQ